MAVDTEFLEGVEHATGRAPPHKAAQHHGWKARRRGCSTASTGKPLPRPVFHAAVNQPATPCLKQVGCFTHRDVSDRLPGDRVLKAQVLSTDSGARSADRAGQESTTIRLLSRLRAIEPACLWRGFQRQR